ncbi:MAG: 2,4-dienoyl-CoA reductase-like NADH-dependent reductase (Old Yellow Enzyme family) [Gammaproteobacteria bacterium]|jgi:2,4-dienoyl-CoA reductase-like NADH-dependent reductase (Old Yellow Enzyme family)
MVISMFDNLLQPIALGPTQISNRLFNPPHGTTLGHGGVVTDDLIAYHKTRAEGGVGLIILEGMTLHPSYGFKESFLYAGSDDIIKGLNKLGEACRAHDTPVFGQLFHAGRAVRLSHDGSKPVTYSASDVPDERYRVIPVPMPHDMVWEMIESYVEAAGRLADANLDGVEILASMGYLIAQFLNPATNFREDEFGGSFDNRLRFLREIITQTRQRIGDSKTLGIRITLDEKSEGGLDANEIIKICQTLEKDNHVDYFSVISGTTASPNGWIHVFPPMAVPHAFVADDAARLKQSVSKPVLVAGRINQPQLAETILSDGKADMVGMVRALITDPEFMNKVKSGQAEDIRACIGCNQACVGHRLAHHPVSCIQNPRAGRELRFNDSPDSGQSKTVIIIGGGPAGMKAALTAAERGHTVHLFEKANRLGGQVNLAEQLPGRAEFGGVTTNLKQELTKTTVNLALNTEVTAEIVEAINPDQIIVAVGAQPRLPLVDIDEDVNLIDAWSVISNEASLGKNVVIADWSCDWTGLGVAEKLARDGHYVRLMSGASTAGESLQGIVRDQWLGVLHSLNVEVTTFARFYGAVGDTAYFQHMTSGDTISCENVDGIVSCYAPKANHDCDWLDEYCRDKEIGLTRVGDVISPRTVEEAVLEGMTEAWNL